VAPGRSATVPVATARPAIRPESLTPAGIEVDERRAAQAGAQPVAPESARPATRPAAARKPPSESGAVGPPRASAEPTASAKPTVKPRPTPRPAPAPRTTPTTTPHPRPSPRPTPAPAPTPIASPVARRPADVLDLRRWKLTLPAGREGQPLEIRQPRLKSLANGTYIRLTPDRGVQFRAPVGGVTTENSNYPRTELREMTADGRREAAWSSTSGRHVMTLSRPSRRPRGPSRTWWPARSTTPTTTWS
jgi:hypothetical protein